MTSWRKLRHRRHRCGCVQSTLMASTAAGITRSLTARLRFRRFWTLRASVRQRAGSFAPYWGPRYSSASTRYTVARLTPNVAAIVITGSPEACIRLANAAFDGSRALGRPMAWPRARRASRAADLRSRPSSSSSSARLARTPATIRPVALEVSMPSRKERRTMPGSPSSRIVVITSAALRPRRSMPTTTMASPGRA